MLLTAEQLCSWGMWKLCCLLLRELCRGTNVLYLVHLVLLNDYSTHTHTHTHTHTEARTHTRAGAHTRNHTHTLCSQGRTNIGLHYVNKIQRDAILCRCLFTAKLLNMFRVPIASIIRSTSKCNCSYCYRS